MSRYLTRREAAELAIVRAAKPFNGGASAAPRRTDRRSSPPGRRSGSAAAYPHDLDAWLDAARGFYAGTKQRREGIVVRPIVETPSATLGGRLSFKVINNDFLLKDED